MYVAAFGDWAVAAVVRKNKTNAIAINFIETSLLT